MSQLVINIINFRKFKFYGHTYNWKAPPNHCCRVRVISNKQILILILVVSNGYYLEWLKMTLILCLLSKGYYCFVDKLLMVQNKEPSFLIALFRKRYVASINHIVQCIDVVT